MGRDQALGVDARAVGVDDLQVHVVGHAARVLPLQRMVPADRLARSTTGKIQRRVLEEWVASCDS